MKPTICSRCKKNIAVIFITKVENGVSTNEGLCLKCARELKIKQVDDIVERMGITDEDLDNLNGEMMAMMQPEPDETGCPKSEVERLIERINAIQSELPAHRAVYYEDEKAFSDAAEEHYAALYRALPAERRKR